MNVTVFGANGKVGSKVVKKLLNQGDIVTAFIHSANNLPQHKHIHIVRGDIKNTNDIKTALKNSEIVICALGSWGTKSKNIISVGMRNIIPSAEESGIKRLVSLTGAGSFVSSQSPNLINRASHFGFSLFNKKILVDGEEHIRLLEKSSLNWVALRSPVMIELGSKNYNLRLKEIMPWKTIHRDAVAKAMVELSSNDTYTKKSPFIFR